MAGTPPRQTRPQSLRYFCRADEATTALEESKTGTWFRFNCACVKLFTHLTKKSAQGKFSLLAHCCNLLFPKQFFFLWPLVDVFGEERQVTWKDCLRRPKMYIYLNTANEHLLVTTTYILSCSEWAQQYANLRVYLGVRTYELFLSVCTFCFLGFIVLTSLFSSFYATGEFNRFLHPGWAKFERFSSINV